MRIAIITLPLHANYGGILQAYALQTILKRMGHNVEIITLSCFLRIPLWRIPFTYIKRCSFKYLFGKKIRIFYEQWYNRTDPLLVIHMKCFIDERIFIRFVNRYNDIKDGEYDAFIVGSDQVWRPQYFKSSIENAYLAFAKKWKNVKRIAYAASFGTDEWEYTLKQTKYCSKLVELFDGVSVREKTAVGLCEHYLHCKAQHVLDPTMLLTASSYYQLFMNKQLSPCDGQLLTYILDENVETENIILQLAAHFGYKPFRVNSRYENYNAPLIERVQPSVEQWLKGFYEAEFIVTDSFHATIFAILFRKPFIVIGNRERGLSRLHSLLCMFSLEKHFVFTSGQINFNMDYSIDTQELDIILDKLRSDSIDYLTYHVRK